MSAGLWVAAALGLASGAWILRPLLRSDAAEAEKISRVVSEEVELRSRKEMILSSLKDLEDDRETGKLLEDDYLELKARLSASASEVLTRLDEIERQRRSPKVRRHPRSLGSAAENG
jgi:hypothetical protein